MCGIVGVIRNKNSSGKKAGEVFTQLLFADTMRGSHGTGIIRVEQDGDMQWWKRALAAPDFMCLDETQRLLEQDLHDMWMFTGHNRYATLGGRTDAACHPFDMEDITLVHNGTIYCHNQLTPNAPNFSVDSAAIAYAIMHQGAIKTLEKVDGAYALVWYDYNKQALFMARNEERPLSYMVDDKKQFLIYASEPDMLRWIAGRNDLEGEIRSVKPGKLLQVDLGEVEPRIAASFRPLKREFVTKVQAGFGHTQGQGAPQARSAPKRTKAQIEDFKRKEQFLKKHGYEFGDKIKFTLASVLKQNYVGMEETGAVIVGYVPECPDEFLVRANRLSYKLVETLGENLTGTIVNMEWQWANGKQSPVIWVMNVQRNNDLDHLFPEVYSRELDQKDFEALTKRGCAWCSDQLTWENRAEVKFDSNGDPLCKDCQKYTRVAS